MNKIQITVISILVLIALANIASAAINPGHPASSVGGNAADQIFPISVNPYAFQSPLIVTGMTTIENDAEVFGFLHGEPVQRHPDTGIELSGHEVENLPAAIELAKRCHNLFNLGFMAVDLMADVMESLVVLGVDGNPRLCPSQLAVGKGG